MVQATAGNDPVRALDIVIQLARGKDLAAGDLERLKARALLSIIALAEGELGGEGAVEETAVKIMDDYRQFANKRLFAICLLRLLAEPAMGWLSENPWRPKVTALLDSQLSEDLYQLARVDKDLLAHQKLEMLTNAVMMQEQELGSALSMLTSLERLGAQRQSLMKALNSNIGRILFLPFLPDDIQAQLGEVYARAAADLDRRDELAQLPQSEL